jgi:Fe-S-cluster containining protein
VRDLLSRPIKQRVPLVPLEGEPDPNGGDCVDCGRYCHHGPKTVSLLEADEERMGPRFLPLFTEVETKPPHFRFIKNAGEYCGALDVSVRGKYPCGIYDVRPQGCRDVEPGSPCCLEARRLGHLGTSVEFKRVAR